MLGTRFVGQEIIAQEGMGDHDIIRTGVPGNF